MTRAKLITFIMLALTLGVIIFLFSYLYKGTLILDPEENSMVIMGKSSYTDFPQEIKLKPGVYKITTKKDGYIDDFSTIKVKAFQKINHSPSLVKAKIINYIDNSAFFNPAVSPSNNEILYYNAEEKEFRKFTFNPTKSISGPITEIAVSDILKFEDFKESPIIHWSPNRIYSSFISSQKRVVVNLKDREEIMIPKSVKDLGFTANDKVVFIDNNEIKTANIDFSDSSSIIKIEQNLENIVLSPKGLFAVVKNEEKAFIYDLGQKKELFKLDKKIKEIQWFDDNLLAYSYENKEGLALASINISQNRQKDLDDLSNNFFAWKDKNTIIYPAKNNFSSTITQSDSEGNNKNTILSLPSSEKLSAILVNNNKIIIGIKNLLYYLD